MEEQEKVEKVEALALRFQQYVSAELHSFEEQTFLDQLMRLITWWPDGLIYRLAERLGYQIHTKFYTKRGTETFALLNAFREKVSRERQSVQRGKGNTRG